MKYRPKVNHPYWYVDSKFEINQSTYDGSKINSARVEAGNCFETPLDADKLLLVIKHRVKLTRWEHLKIAIIGRV